MSEEPEVTKTSVAVWKKAAVHNVCCPSGVRVDIRIPDLPKMIEVGEIPQNLLVAALDASNGGATTTPSVELVKQQREFTDHIVLKTVVNPKLTEADVADIPYEDKDFLVSIATRQRDVDAEGEHIGGLMKSEKFRKFRGFSGGDSDVASV